ncbi:GDSL esterase/lipase APG-like protein [Drosera capensis]
MIKMEMKFENVLSSFVIILVLVLAAENINAQPLVPALIIFGDSSVDTGNNDYIHTLFKANYPPYGRDFIDKKATGRFCNGKLATDITADTLGFTSYPPSYLSPQAAGKNLAIGANFASAGSGYDDLTAYLSHAIPLSQQLEYYKEYQGKLSVLVGSSNANSTLTGALYVIGAGNSDFVQNYFLNPVLQKTYTPAQYASKLTCIFSKFIKDLYKLGARRIGATNLPPLGCAPAAITLFGDHSNNCVTRLNKAALLYNKKLNETAAQLQKQYPDLKLVVFNIYDAVYDLIQRPQDFGFAESRKGCCGTGVIETTIFLCNPLSIGTCRNATEYVFWDAVHPSEAANELLASSLLIQGIDLIS